MKNISSFKGCELKEKNKLYLIFENIMSINDAILNLDRLQSVNN